ncbi:MAG TPA: acetyl-CoA carboxylase biotin carboxyl carrier protein [Chitinophagales bacterium]|nr:acetyl-CoA carboxylase biotin carboxyl carrier protein [Chitinophagales bacterium]HRG27188.1 acetyl-CoA carboxylase biotin carboxyl carrier protein [Chitinophagales bacterium]HRG84123.1 acetyl-CoA carboxylase biotin carboxyl carrier protein [Chitinophagales bacterium]HRH52710.1 acetyl-CoA carboxylase biotin carboxyl carrier protein [Chitinophagales bacterium]
MDFKEIQELIRMVNKNNIAELTIENQDFRIKIKTALAATYTTQAPVVMQQMPQQVAMPQIQQAATSEKPQTTQESAKSEEASGGNTITIKSPIVGTFYRSPGPDKEVFVKVGDEIGVGTKLCIIEAMKLFNEIESEHSGRIVKILVDDASPVEYDQPLFLIEPK